MPLNNYCLSTVQQYKELAGSLTKKMVIVLWYSCFEICFQSIPVKSFEGCLRNFKMNGKIMNAPQQKNGVLPCLDIPMEKGIYFFKEGGYIAIGKECGDYGLNVDTCTQKDFLYLFLWCFPTVSSNDHSSTHSLILYRQFANGLGF